MHDNDGPVGEGHRMMVMTLWLHLGVVSGIGKGIIASSCTVLMQSCGFWYDMRLVMVVMTA